MNLKALVKSNSDLAMVFDKLEPLKYYRIDGMVYGTNGLLYECYYYDTPSKHFRAFGGRKFDIKLEDGEIIHCDGQWCDVGYNKLSELLNTKLCYSAASDLENLRNCYVYYGYNIDQEKKDELVMNYKGFIYDYWDYEKVLKFDNMRSEYFRYQYKSETAKKTLIKKVKKLHNEIELLKSIIPQNPSTLHHDIEYVNLVNKLNEIINGNSQNNENMPVKKSGQGRSATLLDAVSA